MDIKKLTDYKEEICELFDERIKYNYHSLDLNGEHASFTNFSFALKHFFEIPIYDQEEVSACLRDSLLDATENLLTEFLLKNGLINQLQIDIHCGIDSISSIEEGEGDNKISVKLNMIHSIELGFTSKEFNDADGFYKILQDHFEEICS